VFGDAGRRVREEWDMPRFEEELPQLLRWDPGIIYDPIPEWWIRGLNEAQQVELIAVRLEVTRQVLQVQAEGLGRAVEVLRSKKG
jgi:hypothetical protein